MGEKTGIIRVEMMWGVKMGRFNLLGLGLGLFIFAIIMAVTGSVIADDGVHIESSSNCVNVSFASDNFTFSFPNATPITAGYSVYDNGYNQESADNFSWTLLKDGISTGQTHLNVTDNFTTYTFSQPGHYSLQVIAWNGSLGPGDCIRNFYSPDITAKLPINGSINQTYPTYNYQGRLKFNISSNSSIPNTINWNFGDGTSLTQTDYPNAFNHTFPYTSPYSTVDYNINATAINSTDRTLFSDNYTTYTLTMYPPPVSNFNITDNYTGNLITKGPAPVKADMNYLSRTFSSAVTMYPEWNLSDGSDLNTSENFTHIFEHPGIYNVTLKTSTMYGWNLTNHTLMVYDNITSNFTSVQYPCASFPVNVTFRDNSSGSVRDLLTWDYGDGRNDVNLSSNWTNHTYYRPGLYNVTLLGINTTFGISNQSSQWVNIQGLYSNFTANPWSQTIDRGSNAQFWFNDTSSGTDANSRYVWEFEPNKYSFNKNDTYSFSRNGTYNISLTVYNPLCGDSTKGNKTTKQVTVYENLYANITYSPKCGTFPLTVHFTDNSTDTPDTWLWKFYDINQNLVSTIPDNRTPIFEYPTAGTYKVELTAGNLQNAWDVRTFWVTVSDCLQANFTANQTRGYYPFTVNFTDTSTPQSSVSTRIWDFGDQTTGSGATEIHTFSQKGNYNVSLTVTNTSSGMTRVANTTIEVGSPVYANFTPNGTSVVPVNASMIVKFTDLSVPQSEITNWDWNFDDSLLNDTNRSPYHQFTSEGWHNVTLNVSNPYYGAWNVSRARINISVQKAPEASFTVTPEIANRFERVTFVDTSKGESINGWYWQFGDGNSSTGTPAVNYYQNAGTYVVNLTVTNPYGNGTASNTVRVKGPVYADFITDPSGEWGVINQPITFIDASKGQPIHWTWNFGDGNSTTTDSSSITHTYTSTGSYTVNMTGTNWDGQSGSAVKTLQIENKSRPKDVNFGAAGKRYSGNHPFTVQFEDYTPNQSNVTEWYWDFGDRTNSFNTTPVAPSHTYGNPGEYTVTLTVRNEMGVNEKTRVAYVVVV